MQNRSNQTRSIRINRHIAPLVGALLLALSVAAHADDVQDANKLFKQGQHTQAMDKVNGYLAGKPKDAQARFLKGLILTEQGKSADAIKVFSSLTEDYPELPEPYNNLAVLYASQGQYDKAKQSLEMAIRTHPSYATAHENLGDIYAKMASQAYDRALQLDRSNTATQTKLAMIQDLFSNGTRAKPATPVAVAASKPVAAEPVAAAKPAQAAAAPVEKTPKPAANNNGDDVLKAVNSWAAAWSAQNSKKYLSLYASDFKVPGKQSRKEWEASRKERIAKPKSIEVGISETSVSFSDASHATVKFRQTYRASHLKTSSRKTLLMVKSGGDWRIQEERTR
ncbi:MAG: tetratricopeptide repeat protein [Gallionella sp.]|nr:tetratricopeptide repeat protein [Gallionella sp.]MCK9354617.1 tetratricopeptide repeat protein [Gallionella sp.]